MKTRSSRTAILGLLPFSLIVSSPCLTDSLLCNLVFLVEVGRIGYGRVQKMANTWRPRALNLSLMALFYNIARIGGAVGKKDEKDGATRRTKDGATRRTKERLQKRLQKFTKEPSQRMQKMRSYRPSSSGQRGGKS